LKYDLSSFMTCEHDIPGCEAIKVLEELQAKYDKLQAEYQALNEQVSTFSKIADEQSSLAGINEELAQALAKEQAEKTELTQDMMIKDEQISALKKMVYGKSSERMKNQTVNDEIKKENGGPAKTRGKNKDKELVPGSIKEETEEHRLNDKEKSCPECSEPMNQLGDGKKTMTMDWVPGHFLQKTHVIYSYQCPQCREIVTAKGPVRVGDQRRYGAGFIAKIIVSKVADSMPLNRQREAFKRIGIHLAESTLVNLFGSSARELKPIYELLLKEIANCEVVQADETRLLNRADAEANGHVWTFLSDDLIGYVYSNTRGGCVPLKFFGDTTGTLVTDMYSGYAPVGKKGYTRAGCWAHGRRYIYEVRDNYPEVNEALKYIRDMYRVEHQAVEDGVTKTKIHLQMRQTQTKPIAEKLKTWLEEHLPGLPPKSRYANGIRYILKNWKELTEFLSNELVPIDNNASERAVRIVAQGRKNYLFVGNETAGENLAILLSLVETAESHEINPTEYLADVLIKIQTTPTSELNTLLPQNWKPLPKPQV